MTPQSAYGWLAVNNVGTPSEMRSYVDSFNWEKPVVLIAAFPESEYIAYKSSGTYGGARLFGTNQIYSKPNVAVADLYLKPYGNTAQYAWLVSYTKQEPTLWGYVQGSANGRGTQFVVAPWLTSTEFIAHTVTKNSWKFTHPPYNVNPVATVPGQPLGYQSSEYFLRVRPNVNKSSKDRDSLDLCFALLSHAIELLSHRLTPNDRSQGWTSVKQRQLLGLVTEWKQELSQATTIDQVNARIMGRWFLDNGVQSGPISELLARVDNRITDEKEGPWETRRTRKVEWSDPGPDDAPPTFSPPFRPDASPLF